MSLDLVRRACAPPAARLTRVVMDVMPGLMLVGTIAAAAGFLSAHHGGSALLYALLLGIAFNFLQDDAKCKPGLHIASGAGLRAGVVLLGATITFNDVAALGVGVLAIVAAGVGLTLAGGWLIGRAFGLHSDHAVLSAGAVAICGASAAMAISAVLPRGHDTDRNLSLTVIGVTALSTVSMVVYPLLTTLMEWPDRWAGVFIGVTVHDVAQVIGAGYLVSSDAGAVATVVKLMRVLLLVPTLLIVSLLFQLRASGVRISPGSIATAVPSFLLAFAGLALCNSLDFITPSASAAMADTSRWLVTMALAAVGVRTSLRDLAVGGLAPTAALMMQTVLLAVFALCAVTITLRH